MEPDRRILASRIRGCRAKGSQNEQCAQKKLIDLWVSAQLWTNNEHPEAHKHGPREKSRPRKPSGGGRKTAEVKSHNSGNAVRKEAGDTSMPKKPQRRKRRPDSQKIIPCHQCKSSEDHRHANKAYKAKSKRTDVPTSRAITRPLAVGKAYHF